MQELEKVVRSRRSVRTFDGRELTPEDRDRLSAFMKEIENPYGIPIEFRFLDGKAQPLSCPAVTGTRLYLGAKARRVPHIEEAFGYSFELLVLYAQSIGIGTVWVGGTMDRAAFEQAMGLQADEMMPCMSPLGYPAERLSLRESMMRKGISANKRKPFETLFFEQAFGRPLTPEKAGRLAWPLEMVRWAPSAVNKQPWRAVLDESGVHFYLKQSKGFVSEGTGNMQKIDMGIALCHFALAAKEKGISVRFALQDPGLSAESDTVYIASWLLL